MFSSFCNFTFKTIIPILVRLAAFTLYSLSAFRHKFFIKGKGIDQGGDYECSDSDSGFLNKDYNYDFVFGLFLISMFFNTIVLITNNCGYYKLHKSLDQSLVSFSFGAIFSFLSILFWVPGNYISRIDYGNGCILVEGIMVHFYNEDCLNLFLLHGLLYFLLFFSYL